MASGTLSKQGISYYLRKYPKTTITLLLLIIVLLLLLTFKSEPPRLLANADKPQWRGVVVGETTQQATEKILGPPDLVTHCGDVNQVEEGVYGFITDIFDCVKGPTMYMYNEEASYHFRGKERFFEVTHFVSFRDEKLWLIEENQVVYPRETRMTVKGLIEQYGLPEKITWSRNEYNALLFCEQGMIAHVGYERISWMLYFPPMPTKTCLREFKDHLPSSDPYEDSDIINALDPWGYNDSTRPKAASRLELDPNATWQEIDDYIDCAFIKTGMTRQEVEERLSKIGTYKVSSDNSQSTQTVTVEFDEFPLPKRDYRYENNQLVYAARHYKFVSSPIPIDVECRDYLEDQTN